MDVPAGLVDRAVPLVTHDLLEAPRPGRYVHIMSGRPGRAFHVEKEGVPAYDELIVRRSSAVCDT